MAARVIISMFLDKDQLNQGRNEKIFPKETQWSSRDCKRDL